VALAPEARGKFVRGDGLFGMADHRKVARQALVAIDPRFNADPPVSSIAGARGRASSGTRCRHSEAEPRWVMAATKAAPHDGPKFATGVSSKQTQALVDLNLPAYQIVHW